MRILIFHGYLLRGTGSNVYNAELARALAAAGHDVHLLCQDRNAGELEFVDALGVWRGGELSMQRFGRERPEGWGDCSVYTPEIGSLLPVYVADRYEGFSARPFTELDDDQLASYLVANVNAVRDVCELAMPDAALANHLVMGPCILARALPAGVPYAVKVHGSAMEYIVRRDARFLPYAAEGMERCATALVGSRHIAERLWSTLDIEGLQQRTFLGPPGVDVERFVPRDRATARDGLERLAECVEALPRRGYGPGAAVATAALFGRISGNDRMPYEALAERLRELHAGYDTAGIDADAPAALRSLAAAGDAPVALYVGKLIVSKGVDLLLTAWPLVLQKNPEAQLAIVGFGAYREGLEMLLAALSAGDLETVRYIAEGGRAFEGGAVGRLDYVTAFLSSLNEQQTEAYRAAAAGMRKLVHWSGRLEHALLADLLPCADLAVVPSTFPEAFGMVAAEAAACGVPPVCADHSGLAEVVRTLEVNLSGATGSLLSFGIGPQAVARLAARVNGLIALDKYARADLHERLSQTARDTFSWNGVAHGVLSAARGEHRALRRP